jgi:pimeloyl-ACP methyl ester carboxylesterase
MRITANGISINYEIHGRGENLVLIHGAGDNLKMWYHQVPVLSHRYRVITMDIRGHGQTESPEGSYSVPLFAEDVYELIKTIGIKKAYFLGYSMGGGIALGVALQYPEMVRALILANTPVGSPPFPFFLERQRSNAELLAKGDIKTVAENMTTDAFSPGFRSRNSAEFERYMKVKLQNGVVGMSRMSGSSRAPGSAQRAAPDLSKLQCPVLMILGENDVYMDVGQVKQAGKRIPGARLVILPTGHASAIESPERFNTAVLDFLSGC